MALCTILLAAMLHPVVLPPRPSYVLTIDDSPTRSTRTIASNLLDMKAPATFFVIGELRGKDRETVRWLARKGFEIGNHTRSHSYELMRSGSEARIKADLDYITTNVRDSTGRAPRYARPPMGYWSPNFKAAARGMILIDWSLNFHNEEHSIYREVVAEQLCGMRNVTRAIVLIHDRENLQRGIRVIVEECRKRGTIVSLQEALK